MQAESLINNSLLRSFLKRYWPIWLGAAVAFVVLCVMPLFGLLSSLPEMYDDPAELAMQQREIWYLMQGQVLAIVWALAAITALYLNERLFAARAATFYGALPLRRRTVFATTFLAGFLPLAAVEGLVALLLLALSTTAAGITPFMVGEWFALAVGCTFVFLAFAQLACELTGSRAVAAFLYVLMNVLVVCVEGALRLIANALQFGMGYLDTAFELDWASPAFGMAHYVLWNDSLGSVQWMGLGAYCLVGVVVLALAFWLDGRRDAETAGDAVSFGMLRPVLKYLAGICSALLFGALVYICFWLLGGGRQSTDAAGAVAMAVAMAAGALLGVLFAQMVLAKSTHVLESVWKGGLVLACASVLLVGACYADPLGLTTQVPEADDVESVEMLSYGMKVADISSEEGIDAVRTLHRNILDNRDELQEAARHLSEGDYNGVNITLCYHLKSGSLLERSYPVYRKTSDADSGEASAAYAVLEQATEIVNGEEGRISRLAPALQTPETCTFELYVPAQGEPQKDENGEVKDDSTIKLSRAQAADFAASALKPDALERGSASVVGTEPYYGIGEYEGSPTELDVQVYIYTQDGASVVSYWVDTEKTPNTVQWLKKNYPNLKAHYSSGEEITL